MQIESTHYDDPANTTQVRSQKCQVPTIWVIPCRYSVQRNLKFGVHRSPRGTGVIDTDSITNYSAWQQGKQQ